MSGPTIDEIKTSITQRRIADGDRIVEERIAKKQKTVQQSQPQQETEKEKRLKIGFQNIQGLYGKQEEVDGFMEEEDIDIMCLVESWLTPGANHKFEPTTIADVRMPIAEQGRQGQCGILVVARNRNIADQVVVLHKDKEGRYCVLEIGTERLVVCYFPPRPELDAAMFTMFEDLQTTAPLYEQTTVVGDLNAKHVSMGSRANNGRGRALHHLLENSAWHAPEPTIGNHTTPNNRPDHVIHLGGEIHEYQICEEIVTQSDHLPLVFNINASIDTIDKKYSRIQIGKLREKEVRNEYYRKMMMEFQNIMKYLGMTPRPKRDHPLEARQTYADTIYGKFCAKLLEALEEVVGRKLVVRRRTRRDFKTEDIRKAEQDLLDLRYLERHGNTEQRRFANQHIGYRKQRLAKLVQERRKEIFDQMAEAIDQGQIHVFQKMVSCMKGRALKTGCQLDWTKLAEYNRHYESTFGGTPGGTRTPDEDLLEQTDPRIALESVDEDTPEFDEETIFEIINRCKNGKAAGKDEIQAEMLKVRSINPKDDRPEDRVVTRILAWLFEEFTRLSVIPSIWKTAVIVPVWKKKGSATDIKNYRPIALTSVVRRIYEQTWLKHSIYRIIDHHLADTQGGFRVKRSTYHQIMVVHEACLRHPNSYKAFLDIQAAYDCVNRGLVWTQLRHKFGLTLKQIQICRVLFDDNEAQLRVRNHHGPTFPIRRGFVQGSSMSPILFNAFIDEFIHRLNAHPRVEVGGYQVNNAFFADDGVIIANSKEDLTRMLETTETWGRETGTTFAATKCEVMGPDDTAFKIDGIELPRCEAYKYLGMMMTNDLRSGRRTDSEIDG